MSTQELKSKLVNFIQSEADDDQLEYMYKLVSSEHEKDFWLTLSEEEKNEIEQGLKDGEEGRTISHEEAMKRLEKWR